MSRPAGFCLSPRSLRLCGEVLTASALRSLHLLFLAHIHTGVGPQFAAGLLAGALVDVLPVVGILVGFSLAGAGMLGVLAAAVVLAGLGDAVALFPGRLVGGEDGASGPEGEQLGDGGGGDGLGRFHVVSPCRVE